VLVSLNADIVACRCAKMHGSLFRFWRLLIARRDAHIALGHPVASLIEVVIPPARGGSSAPTGIGDIRPRGSGWCGTGICRTGSGVARRGSSPAWVALRQRQCVTGEQYAQDNCNSSHGVSSLREREQFRGSMKGSCDLLQHGRSLHRKADVRNHGMREELLLPLGRSQVDIKSSPVSGIAVHRLAASWFVDRNG
jgi:hypothetical protein